MAINKHTSTPSTPAPHAPAPPTVTPLAVGGTPAATHKQPQGGECRLALTGLGVAYGNGKNTDSISPNMTMMTTYANAILAFNTLPALTKIYAPNEMPSLLHDLQVKLGV